MKLLYELAKIGLAVVLALLGGRWLYIQGLKDARSADYIEAARAEMKAAEAWKGAADYFQARLNEKTSENERGLELMIQDAAERIQQLQDIWKIFDGITIDASPGFAVMTGPQDPCKPEFAELRVRPAGSIICPSVGSCRTLTVAEEVPCP
jgi:hypothetical protein